MNKQSDRLKEISLGDTFGAIALKVNGIRLEVDADGKNVKIISDAPVGVSIAANAPNTATAITAAQKALEIGDVAADGYIYAGLSEDPASPKYKKPLWVAPKDAGIKHWAEAQRAAMDARPSMKKKVRLPTANELTQIFTAFSEKNIGGIDMSGEFPGSWYWGAENGKTWAVSLQAKDGRRVSNAKQLRANTRFVY